MKRAIYSLLGDRAGRVVLGTWRWLWGLPVESGGGVAVAQESLQSMQNSVRKLAAAVATQVGSYDLSLPRHRGHHRGRGVGQRHPGPSGG